MLVIWHSVGSDSGHISVEIHHGGFFCGIGVNHTYVNEKVDWFDHMDVDLWCYFWVVDFVSKLGYEVSSPNLRVHWLLPGKNIWDGLRIISNDGDTEVMRQFAGKMKNFVLYIDHHYQGLPPEDIVMNPVSDLPKVLSPRKVQHVDKIPGERLPDIYKDLPKADEICEVDLDDGGSEGEFYWGSGSDDSEEDPDCVDSGNEVEDGDDDLFMDNVVEPAIRTVKKSKKAAGSRSQNSMVVVNDAPEEADTVEEEELELPADSDAEGGVRLNFKSFMPEDLNNPIFKLGMTFPSAEIVRNAVTEYSLRHRVDLKMPRNDQRRIGAHCAEGCPWNLYVSKDSRTKNFVVKRYVPEHNCRREWALRRCTAAWLGQKYLDSFRADPKMTLGNFGRIVQKEWNLIPSRSKLCRARSVALRQIYGDEVAQYNHLWDYGQEVRRSNPGSTFYLGLGDGHFSHLYISLDACKRGFLTGCRPVICLDGCHIKTKFGGQLLTAVGVDPNDCIFPIAYAVVEVESKATWKWFLETLKQDLNIQNTYPWTIMTDKQKGLIPAVQEVFPDSEHRFCVRHLYQNFSGNFKGENLKNQLWACARSTTVTQFNTNMEKMKTLDSKAHAWLEQMPPNTWVKAYFSCFPKCDILLNNSCEVFNNYIREARELPILSMVDKIKGQLMVRFYSKQKELSEKWTSHVCPKIRKKLLKNSDFSNMCFVLPAGKGVFQVQSGEKNYIVNILTKSCDCRKWDLTGIPCNHTVACLRHERIPAEEMLPSCYSAETYNKVYGFNIMPCKDKSLWEKTNGPTVLPPIYEKKVGRPPKSRRKQPQEVQGKHGPKLSRHGTIITCSWCKGENHNRAGCPFRKLGLRPGIRTNPAPPVEVYNVDDSPVQEPVITQVESRLH